MSVVGKPVSSLALIFNIMLYYTIISLDENLNECNDEIVSTFDLQFKKWDILEKSHYFPKRTIERVIVEPI